MMGHNGPAGLGSRAWDICGVDWESKAGDHGDPDLQVGAGRGARGESRREGGRECVHSCVQGGRHSVSASPRTHMPSPVMTQMCICVPPTLLPLHPTLPPLHPTLPPLQTALANLAACGRRVSLVTFGHMHHHLSSRGSLGLGECAVLLCRFAFVRLPALGLKLAPNYGN